MGGIINNIDRCGRLGLIFDKVNKAHTALRSDGGAAVKKKNPRFVDGNKI